MAVDATHDAGEDESDATVSRQRTAHSHTTNSAGSLYLRCFLQSKIRARPRVEHRDPSWRSLRIYASQNLRCHHLGRQSRGHRCPHFQRIEREERCFATNHNGWGEIGADAGSPLHVCGVTPCREEEPPESLQRLVPVLTYITTYITLLRDVMRRIGDELFRLPVVRSPFLVCTSPGGLETPV